MWKYKLVLLFAILLYTNFSIAQISPKLSPYVTFLNNQWVSAKEYILNLFKTHDIVVICERDHREITQYDLLLDVIKDKRFITEVGNVFTELGVSNLNPDLNTFLHAKNLPEAEQQSQILFFQRNMDPMFMWDKYNYTYLLKSLYNLNNQLSFQDAINLYPSNIPLDWKKVDSTNYKQTVLPLLRNRDSVIAAQIIERFDKINRSFIKRKKALVIMNFRHAFKNEFLLEHGQKINNVTEYLYEHYGNRVANVYLYGLNFDEKENQVLLQKGKWDAAFKVTGNKSSGFNLINTPFGKDSFDLWPLKNSYNYQDVFTGFVFYKPINEMKLVTGIPGYIDSSFANEFFRRLFLCSTLSPGTKLFYEESMERFKENPDEWQKNINEKREQSYSGTDSLFKIRDQWIK
jgi:hypothetical protein